MPLPIRAFRFTAVVVATIEILCGCSTGYHESSMFGGYSSNRIGYNSFWINFSGNGYTSSFKSNDLAILRAAEVCKTSGFNYFILTEGDTSFYQSATVTSLSTYSIRPGVSYSTGISTPIYTPSTSLQIICFRKRPRTNLKVLNASEIVFAKTKAYKIDLPPSDVDARASIQGFEKEVIDWVVLQEQSELSMEPSAEIQIERESGDANFSPRLSLVLYDNIYPSEDAFDLFLRKLAVITGNDFVKVDVLDTQEVRRNFDSPIKPCIGLTLGISEKDD